MSFKTQQTLIGESFSPWTKKARWALEYCEVAYEYQEYTPTLSEPGLRWRMRQFTGAVSVPVLFVDNKIVRGSWEIACYASDFAGDTRLGDLDEIEAWNALSEVALAEGRSNVVRRILCNELALEEGLSSFVPSLMRSHFRFLARDAVRRLDRKYRDLVKPGALVNALQQLRDGLAKSENDYLLGKFSYADIAMAAVLEVVAPIAHTEPPLGPVTKTLWNDIALSHEYQDLVDWRDRLAANVKTTYSQYESKSEL